MVCNVSMPTAYQSGPPSKGLTLRYAATINVRLGCKEMLASNKHSSLLKCNQGASCTVKPLMCCNYFHIVT